MKIRRRKSSFLFLLLLLLPVLTSCDWNLYTSSGLIKPEITLTYPASVQTGTGSFNLLAIAPEDIPSYSINVSVRGSYTLLKGQSAEATERFIEALSYLSRTGRLEEVLKSVPGGMTAEAVRGTLSFTEDTLSSIRESIDALDIALQQILQAIAGLGISVPEIHFFSDLSKAVSSMADTLDRKDITVADYITLQYYIDILSALFRLSVPVISIVYPTVTELTLDDITELVEGDGLSEELQKKISEALKANSSSLLGILIDALSAVDQTGRLVKEYIPALPDISAVIRALSGGGL